MKKYLAGLTAWAVLALPSCVRPIDADVAANARDQVPPVISIASPADYASFSRTIAISGRVTDLSAGGAPGQVEGLTAEIVSHTGAVPVAVAANGSFTANLPNDLKENVVVLLKAVDWHGNAVERRVPLTYAGNDIPSFAAAEGNRQTTLSWSSVPGVGSYTLYYEPSAKTPDPATSPSVTGVTSPWTFTQLKNGSLYSFLLTGATAEGKTNTSQVVRSVPLSAYHLLPRAAPAYGGVGLSWRSFPSLPGYTVLRADSPSGPWTDVSGPVTGSTYFDPGALPDRSYYYSVRPSAYSSVRSLWTEASTDPAAGTADGAVGSFDGALIAQRSVWQNDLLYISDFWHGLWIVDVSQPAVPRKVSDVTVSGGTGLAVSGHYAYVTGYKKLTIIDIADPKAPVQVSAVDLVSNPGANTTFQAGNVAVAGGFAVVAGFNQGFSVVDVSNPAAPVLRIENQGYPALGQNYGAALRASGPDWILAVSGLNATGLYKISGTPAAPTVTPQSTSIPGATDLAFSGTLLVVSTGSGVAAWQTSSPALPSLLGSVVPPGSAPTEGLSLDGTRAYVALRDYGFAVVDFSVPASLKTIRVRNVPGSPNHVSAGGGYLYVAAGQDFPLPIYGADDPAGAAIVQTLTDVNTGTRLAASRDRLYVTEFRSGDWAAAVYDVSNPAATVRMANPSSVYTPYDLEFAGDQVAVAGERSGFLLWTAVNPNAPTAQYPWYESMPNGSAWAVRMFGHYALLGTSSSWVDVIDVSRPQTWSLVASVQTQGTVSATTEIRRLTAVGSTVFTANETAGLRAVDLTNPEAPRLIPGYGALPAGGSAAAVASTGNYLLVADSANGLLVYDGSAPDTWSASGQARVWPAAVSGGGALDVAVRGNYAYVAKGASGLQIYDLSNPRSPALLTTLTAAGFSPTALTLYKNYLYALDGATKLYVVRLVP